ncbi:MAG TPA: hypothetical protein ENN31_01385 [Candidatus Vogelbacteria bacterium]|nr:hypothetical protein [Candidatus Vogelbacteria bacterium]
MIALFIALLVPALTILIGLAVYQLHRANIITGKKIGWTLATICIIIALGFLWRNWETITATTEEPSPFAPGLWYLELELLDISAEKAFGSMQAEIIIGADGQPMVIRCGGPGYQYLWTRDIGNNEGKFVRRWTRPHGDQTNIIGKWLVNDDGHQLGFFSGQYEYIIPRGKDAGKLQRGLWRLHRL